MSENHEAIVTDHPAHLYVRNCFADLVKRRSDDLDGLARYLNMGYRISWRPAEPAIRR